VPVCAGRWQFWLLADSVSDWLNPVDSGHKRRIIGNVIGQFWASMHRLDLVEKIYAR